MGRDVISIDIPMSFKKRGGRKVIVLPDGSQGHPEPAEKIDNAMVKAIARAFRWQRLLENGTYGCIDDIAKTERICPSFVGKIFRLSLGQGTNDLLDAVLDFQQHVSVFGKAGT